MGDYDPLREYLSRQTLAELVLSFETIEDILGFALPRASQRASWWEKERNPKMRGRSAMQSAMAAMRRPVWLMARVCDSGNCRQVSTARGAEAIRAGYSLCGAKIFA